MEAIKTLLIVTAIAGIGGTGLGGLIGALLQKDSNKTVSLLLSFAGGIMLGVVCLDLIVEALATNAGLMTVIGSVALGVAIIYFLNYLIDRHTNPEVPHIDAQHPKTADDLNELINTSLISDLNPPADEELFADTSYIKPGKVAWSWWAEGSYTGVYDKHIEYIDFAAENGWDHICMDADWRNFEPRLAEICQYAKDKGVGIFVWVNYRDLKDKASMETLIAKWKAAGVVGLKTDYFESDEPSVLQVMQNVAECCAKNQLMVLYHGCIRPGGECRTYPNILSTEAVLGEEFHKWSTEFLCRRI
jgi:hypothetical protein